MLGCLCGLTSEDWFWVFGSGLCVCFGLMVCSWLGFTFALGVLSVVIGGFFGFGFDVGCVYWYVVLDVLLFCWVWLTLIVMLILCFWVAFCVVLLWFAYIFACGVCLL